MIKSVFLSCIYNGTADVSLTHSPGLVFLCFVIILFTVSCTLTL